jgi:hypothetical protein
VTPQVCLQEGYRDDPEPSTMASVPPMFSSNSNLWPMTIWNQRSLSARRGTASRRRSHGTLAEQVHAALDRHRALVLLTLTGSPTTE